MPDVFVSHSSKDRKTAEKIVEYLENKGLVCWIAPRNIIAGSDWAASISTAISDSKVFLVVYSANSSVSEQCTRELDIAEAEKGVFVVPYKTDESELVGAYKYFLTGSHWVSANVKSGDFNLEELFTRITGITGMPEPPAPAAVGTDMVQIAAENTKNTPWIKRNAALIAVSAVAVIAIGVALAALMWANKAPVPASPAETTAAVTTTSAVAVTTAALPDTSGTLKDYKLVYNDNEALGEYTGDLNDAGLPDGNGVFTGTYTPEEGEEENSLKIEGQFRNGYSDGEADVEISFPDGEKINYDRITFKEGVMQGITRGVDRKVNGDVWVFEGYRENGVFCGTVKETCNYANGNTYVFEGEYKDNKRNGPGKYTRIYAEPSESGVIKETGEGMYSDGLRNGSGKISIDNENGSTFEFEGEFKNGARNGHGEYVYTFSEPDEEGVVSEAFAGNFKNDKQNGEATKTITYSDGRYTVFSGTITGDEWRDGTVVTTYDADGNAVTAGTYDNGKIKYSPFTA